MRDQPCAYAWMALICMLGLSGVTTVTGSQSVTRWRSSERGTGQPERAMTRAERVRSLARPNGSRRYLELLAWRLGEKNLCG